jgi:cardiolipin synthase A/B
MTTRLALPILHVSVRLHLVRGRPWSVIEQAILVALTKEELNVSRLAGAARLPHRLTIESLIRLMRAGWVELVEERSEVRFRASDAGRVSAKLEELPRIATPLSRVGRYVVDQFTGACFRARDMKIYSSLRIEEFVNNGSVVKIDSPATKAIASQADAITALLDEDEEIRGFDEIGTRESDRYALLTVRGSEIDGLPGSAPDSLRSLILAAAKDVTTKGVTTVAAIAPQRDPFGVREYTEIDISPDDLFVVGGEAHRVAIVDTLRQAKEWVVIHSTFLNNDAFDILSEEIVAACDRGVRVDILWGQSDNSPSRGQTLREIRTLLSGLQVPGAGASINISPFSTGSHAKVVLSDSKQSRMTALVGSCNWLSTQYGSLEVSLRLRDPRIVSSLAAVVAELARPTSGHWSPLSRDLAGHAVNLRRFPIPTRVAKQRVARARLVLGGDHNNLILRARDEAKNRIVIGSHRLGANAMSLAFDPMLAAIAARDVSVSMHYSQAEPDVPDPKATFRLSNGAQDRGTIELRQVQSRLHAKFLYWDDSDVLVTSQNPLSADPGHTSALSELGVHISAPDIATHFHQLLRSHLM